MEVLGAEFVYLPGEDSLFTRRYFVTADAKTDGERLPLARRETDPRHVLNVQSGAIFYPADGVFTEYDETNFNVAFDTTQTYRITNGVASVMAAPTKMTGTCEFGQPRLPHPPRAKRRLPLDVRAYPERQLHLHGQGPTSMTASPVMAYTRSLMAGVMACIPVKAPNAGMMACLPENRSTATATAVVPRQPFGCPGWT